MGWFTSLIPYAARAVAAVARAGATALDNYAKSSADVTTAATLAAAPTPPRTITADQDKSARNTEKAIEKAKEELKDVDHGHQVHAIVFNFIREANRSLKATVTGQPWAPVIVGLHQADEHVHTFIEHTSSPTTHGTEHLKSDDVPLAAIQKALVSWTAYAHDMV